METSGHSVELKISKVLSDIRQKGYSFLQPFSIGKVEQRMMHFAQISSRQPDEQTRRSSTESAISKYK